MTNNNLFIDRYGTLHSTPTCEEFHKFAGPDPRNTMPAVLVLRTDPRCADCID